MYMILYIVLYVCIMYNWQSIIKFIQINSPFQVSQVVELSLNSFKSHIHPFLVELRFFHIVSYSRVSKNNLLSSGLISLFSLL